MIFRVYFIVLTALLSVGYSSVLQARTTQVEIRWTQYGIPHVKADNYVGLGYGYGYASARTSVCELADRITTLRGQRSGLFGPAGNALVGFVHTTNLDSDLFYRVMLSDAAVSHAYDELSANARDLVDGYAAGFNRYVREVSALPGHPLCGGIRIPEMRAADIVGAMMQIGTAWKAADVAPFASSSTWKNLTEGTSGPPAQDRHASISPPVDRPAMASNAWAYGSNVTTTGAAIVIANPHSFWQPHWLSMHEIQLTIPGRIDVYGADFLGLPVSVVGFTNNVAWSIEAPSTVTYHLLLALKIKPGIRPFYEVDGALRRIAIRPIGLHVRQADGSVATEIFRVPYSAWGPIYRLDAAPGRVAGWYAITDANEGNAQGIDQMLAVATSSDVKEFELAVARHRGVTGHLIAGDRFGEALYIESGPLLDIDDLTLRRCAVAVAPEGGVAPHKSLNILDGSKSVCSARGKNGRPRLALASRIPVMATHGIVYNMNDSYHLSVFGERRGGYSLLLGDPTRSPGLRKLMSQRHIAELLAAGRLNEENATDVMFSDRNYAAETSIDGILDACVGASPGSSAASACSILRAWDRRNNSESRGALMFREVWSRLRAVDGFYSSPFDSANPFRARSVSRDPSIAAEILQKSAQAEDSLRKLGLNGDEPWGSILARTTPSERVPLHGGAGDAEGILNAISPADLKSNGFAHIVAGTSYVQVVTWKDGRVLAKVLLAHGQSVDSTSEHYSDQLPLFAQKRPVSAAFTERDIEADPNLEMLKLNDDVLQPSRH
jgi:acyl-homoserine-lactone acylase